MRQFLLFLTFITFSYALNAQNEEDSIKMVINRLFEGMKYSDTKLLQAAFADSAILQTIIKSKEGKTVIANETVDEFAAIVSKMARGDADERIVYDIIKVDGPLAIVWAPYHFFYKGVFNHCGIDSFELVKINREWKIQYLIDTRRKTSCE